MLLHCGVEENSWVPWTARRSNRSNLKEISPEYLLEGLMLKLKLQSFGHLMQRADSFKKTLMLGKIEGKQWRGWQRIRMLSHFSHVRLFANPWNVARQAPLSMGFSRQEYWSRLPFPFLGDRPNPRIKPRPPALTGRFFTAVPPLKPSSQVPAGCLVAQLCPTLYEPVDCNLSGFSIYGIL